MGFVPPQQHLTSAPQQRPRFPFDVIREKSRVFDARTGPQVTECGEPAQRIPAEKRPAIDMLLAGPGHDPRDGTDDESGRQSAANAVGHRISRRADSAWAMVTPSAYSRSPPTGRPRAMRETVSG